jgi:subtilisin family serine protease
MPLAPTGVPEFAAAHPDFDGRGVLIAILDSGLDPTVPGLITTSTGVPKILDVRDFSGEGRVALHPITVKGDSVTLAGRTLGGFSRIRSFTVSREFFGGVVAELPLGTPLTVDPRDLPGSDLDGNGRYTDSLAVVVTRTQSGWAVFIDSDGDGSLANERPAYDFRVARQPLAWGGADSPIGLAVNFTEEAGLPILDLVFDTSGHGTHVAGIAAGHDMYGVVGFDGVAPGARLLGLKIANNSRGVSVTGSMVRALAYAVEFAEARRLPLVVNLSFGVGNERPGSAWIDRFVDSVLAVHSGVVMAVSAGNEGPGLSTVGFPGSAARAISVGATFPLVFLRRPGTGAAPPDPMAYFSSRGGALAKPDLVAPGVAYSTVPAWNSGHERNAGTSMASPHVAGLAARLMSGTAQLGWETSAALIKRALMVTAIPVPGASYLDDGTGVPDLTGAWRWLESVQQRGLGAFPAEVAVATQWDAEPAGGDRPPTVFANPTGGVVTLTSTASWLDHAPWLPGGDSVRLMLSARSNAVSLGGAATGVVLGWGDDRSVGPLFRHVTTLVRPVPAGKGMVIGPFTLAAGTGRPVFLEAERGRPFQVRVEGSAPRLLFTRLYEPGPMPFRGVDELQAGPEDERAVYQVDAADVTDGRYQAVVVASPVVGGSASVSILHAAFTLQAERVGDSVVVVLTNRGEGPASATPRVALIGATRSDTVVGESSDAERRLRVRLPSWARTLEIDVDLPTGSWGRFTDFGVTLLDSLGRVIALEPMDYARGRLRLPLTEAHRGIPVDVVLSPALADTADQVPWVAAVTSRVYAASAVPLLPVDATGQVRTWPAGTTDTTYFRMRSAPWPLDDALTPLGLVMTETAGPTWTRTVALAPPRSP